MPLHCALRTTSLLTCWTFKSQLWWSEWYKKISFVNVFLLATKWWSSSSTNAKFWTKRCSLPQRQSWRLWPLDRGWWIRRWPPKRNLATLSLHCLWQIITTGLHPTIDHQPQGKARTSKAEQSQAIKSRMKSQRCDFPVLKRVNSKLWMPLFLVA